MILLGRHLFFAWLTYGAIQLALLGVPGASRQLAVGSRDGRPQTATQPVSLVKQLLAPDVAERHGSTPFAASAAVVLGLTTVEDRGAVRLSSRQATTIEPAALPPARAPPARA